MKLVITNYGIDEGLKRYGTLVRPQTFAPTHPALAESTTLTSLAENGPPSSRQKLSKGGTLKRKRRKKSKSRKKRR